MKRKTKRKALRELPEGAAAQFSYTEDRRLFFRAGDGSRWEVHPGVTMDFTGPEQKVTMDPNVADLIEEGVEDVDEA